MYYTGIGSRSTPIYALRHMRMIGYYLGIMGFTLRSGGADGADKAFEDGADQAFKENDKHGAKDIYLPWKGFNNNESKLILDTMEHKDDAYSVAYNHHPNWMACSDVARKFHARNSFQVLGDKLGSPSAFIICWTPDSKITGGTGQALRIATEHDIPIMFL